MDIKVTKLLDNALLENEIEVVIRTSNDSKEIENLIQYIKHYSEELYRTLIVSSDNIMKEISYDDIICFYSDKKYNYCRTREKSYKIKSKLYEIEKLDPNFIRISKACIINSKQINAFDLSETGQIVVILNDNSREFVSRRKVKSIMEFLDERSV